MPFFTDIDSFHLWCIHLAMLIVDAKRSGMLLSSHRQCSYRVRFHVLACERAALNPSPPFNIVGFRTRQLYRRHRFPFWLNTDSLGRNMSTWFDRISFSCVFSFLRGKSVSSGDKAEIEKQDPTKKIKRSSSGSKTAETSMEKQGWSNRKGYDRFEKR
jgi:hypothetical protein